MPPPRSTPSRKSGVRSTPPSRSCGAPRWNEIVPFLAFPGPIRKILYTTNAIESLNFQFRKALNPRGHFPSDDAAFKLLYLALLNHKNKGRAPKEWGNALAHFQVMFADRFPVG